MGRLLKQKDRAQTFLSKLQSTVKSLTALQSLLAFADALVLVNAYYLIVQTVAKIVIFNQRTDFSNLYLAIALILVRLPLGFLSSILNSKISYKVESSLREEILAKIIEKGAFAKSYSPSLVSLANEAVDSIVPFFTAYLKGKKKAIAFPLVMGVAVFLASPLSALVLVVIAPLIPIFMILIGKVTQKVNQRQLESLTRLSERFYQSFLNLPLIRLYALELKQRAVIKRSTKRWRVETLQILYVAFLSSAALEFFSTVGVALCAILLGFAIYENGFPYASALFVLFCVPEFFAPLRMLGSFYHQKQRAVAAALKICEILELEKQESCGESCKKRQESTIDYPQFPTGFCENNSFPTKHDSFSQQDPTDLIKSHRFSHNLQVAKELMVDNLTVAYPDGRLGLKNLSLTIPTHKICALKGPSGVGKTTLLLTLFNQLQVQEGKIYLGDEDYFSLFSEKSVAFIPQNPHLFYGTLRDNLTLWQKDLSDEELIKRLKDIGAYQVVALFKEGLNKRVGESQRLISGGQMRLIALARTMLKDSELILLDEPSASLDEDTERDFLEKMRKFYQGKTVIMASHRALTLDYCDEVLNLESK